MTGTHPWMLVTAECAAMDTARKIVSAVVAPIPTRNPARHDRVTVWDAMIANYRDYLRTEFRARDATLRSRLEQALEVVLFRELGGL